ncbi:hypothetical protein CIK05_08315 [Bdellovibrio sp. qaytius]|nr:hypothetical protein CIK05_08315 [Bdellovibrio sp. qaytius]
MKNLNVNKTVLFILLASFAFSGLSCAKKQSKIRGAKTTQQVLNPQVTANSIQAGDTQDISYMLKSVSVPEQNDDGSSSVTSEILSRQSTYIPFNTTHKLNEDAYGVYDDASQGTKLDIRSRCLGAECAKYVILITVVKNGYAYHQMAAISNKDDDFFWVEQRNYKVVTMFKSVDEVLAQYPNL